MTTETEIKPAIARSISHNEIVRLEVADPKEALSSIDNDENVTGLDWNDLTLDLENVKGGLDVWGSRLGEDFHLYIVADSTEGEKKYDYANISSDGQSWINDLRKGAPETNFPDIDPSDMRDDDVDVLCAYLRADDGSLSEEDQEFSSGVADEIEALKD